MKGLVLTQSKEQGLAVVAEGLLASGAPIDWVFQDPGSLSLQEIKEMVHQYRVTLIDGELSLNVGSIIKKRSVESHFLNYFDLIHSVDGELWGHSVFSEVFLELLRNSIENQDFKGPVIFLGDNEKVFPIIDVLAGFGFEDFVFLQLEDQKSHFHHYSPSKTGLLQAQISQVDSTAFIQSQKEYSFCFVMSDHYEKQTLEDMSYFHFLSSRSIVFDLSGQSNFLFDEVNALGVNVTEYEKLAEVWKSTLHKRLQTIT